MPDEVREIHAQEPAMRDPAITELLLPNEHIVYEGKYHPILYLKTAVQAVISFVLLLFLRGQSHGLYELGLILSRAFWPHSTEMETLGFAHHFRDATMGGGSILFGIMIFLSLGTIGNIWMKITFFRVIVTDHRVFLIEANPVLRSATAINAEWIASAQITQDLYGKIFGYGDVGFYASGQQIRILQTVADPLHLYREMQAVAYGMSYVQPSTVMHIVNHR